MKEVINVPAGQVSLIVEKIHQVLARQPDIFQFNETLVRINDQCNSTRIYAIDKNWLYIVPAYIRYHC